MAGNDFGRLLLTAKFVNVYGWLSLGIMSILLALMWLRVIPESLYTAMFIIAALLFSGRIILRVMLMKHERQSEPTEPKA